MMDIKEKIINIDEIIDKSCKSKKDNFDNDIDSQISDHSHQIRTLIKSTQIILAKNHKYGINNDFIQRLSETLFSAHIHLDDKKTPGSLYYKKLRNINIEFNKLFEELLQILREKLNHDDNKNNTYTMKLNRIKEKMLIFFKNQSKNLSMQDISEIGKFLNLIDDLLIDTRLVVIYRPMFISLERLLNQLYKKYNYVDLTT